MEKKLQTMKMNEVVSHYLELAAVIREKKIFAGDVTLAIVKNQKMLQENVEIRDEAVKSLVEKYVKHKDGNPEQKEVQKKIYYVFENAEDEKAFGEACKELDDTDLEIEIQTVSYDMLKENEKYNNPTAADLLAMDFMIAY